MSDIKGTFPMNGEFVLDCWYVAAWDSELIDGKKLARTIMEKPVLLYRGDSGQVVALDDRCCHRAAPLSMGRIEGDCVRCMYHGMKYDPSGKCIEIPGQPKVPPKLGVRSYPIVERDHLVWIWMGEQEQADPDQIPSYPPLSDRDHWRGLPCYLHYDANWMLIVDNLSDFAHLAFVHTNTLGGSEEYAYTTKPTAVERLDDGFRVERWHRNSDAPPFHRRVISDKDAKLDRRNIGHMEIPGIFVLKTRFAPAGWDADNDDLPEVRQYYNCQFMTPETRSKTHFFWNYLHNFDLDDAKVTLSLRDSLFEGFYEDKALIEAQQKIFDGDPDYQLLAIAADAPLAHFRRLMDRRMDAQRKRSQSNTAVAAAG